MLRAGMTILVAAAICACGGEKKAAAGAPASSKSVEDPVFAPRPHATTPRGMVVEINAMTREVFYTLEGAGANGPTRATVSIMVGLDEPRGLIRVMTSTASYSEPPGGGFKGGGLNGESAEIPFGAAKAAVDRKRRGETSDGEAVKSVTFTCAGRKDCIALSTGGAFSPVEKVATFSIACLDSVCPLLAERLNALLSG